MFKAMVLATPQNSNFLECMTDYFYKNNLATYFFCAETEIVKKLTVDTKIILLYNQPDCWLEYIVKKILKIDCKILYYKDRCKTLYDCKEKQFSLPLNFLENLKNSFPKLNKSAKEYKFAIQNVLSELNFKQSDSHTIFLCRLILKYIQVGFSDFSNVRLKFVVEQLGHDFSNVSRNLTKFIKEWYYSNKKELEQTFPVLKNIENKPFKDVFLIFFNAIYDKIIRFKKDDFVKITSQLSIFNFYTFF